MTRGQGASGVQIEVLVTEDCPHRTATLARVRNVAGRLVPAAEVAETIVASDEDARRLRFPGSPTVRVEGRDLEGGVARPAALACRTYEGVGTPPEWLVEAGLLRALEPRFILFLCVANAARSQMAEGLARALAPEGVRVGSAGSAPARRSERATRALAELGIDISDQFSKGMDAFDDAPVDTVITLCAEEVCPAWLGQAHRVHWGLLDPGAAEGTEAEQLAVFRTVRDELRRRLEALFGRTLGS
ncbi:MAG: arsenate reductase ArsC [Gemmatimonadota bacterium]